MPSCRLALGTLVVLIGSTVLLGQNQAGNSASTEASRNVRRREQWFMQGRSSVLEPAANARYRTLRQKIASRAIGTPNSPIPNSSGSAFSGDWIQLGPQPVISDASGVGLQDYNYVAGRATAVAIDPADPTGNTVYLGGAFGGVWKSTNAGPLSPSPGSVAWVPLTDNQATLAVGSIAIKPQLSNPDATKSVILVGTGRPTVPQILTTA
jgi:hypothetical protein